MINNLPADFVEKMQELLGTELDAFLKSYEENKFQALRFNTLKLDEDKEKNEIEILEKLGISETKRVSWADDAYYYEDTMRPGKHPYHEMGLYYIQEPSAMSPAALLAPVPGMKVLDLCAAPGGKSTQLATYIGDEGLLVSNEINTARSRVLSQNIERMGIKNAIVTNEDTFSMAAHFPNFFDAIQVDAPCSGEGMFRKLPEATDEWSTENVYSCAERQKEILDNAAIMLKSQGVIVYSTCTFSKEENEDVVDSFIEKHPDFKLEKMERYWPHKDEGEGHFAARLVRGNVQKSYESKKPAVKSASIPDIKLLEKFLSETVNDEFSQWIMSGNLMLFKEQLYRLPDIPVDLKGVKVQRAGLHIGEFKKNRFEPSHSLALALKKTQSKNCFNMRVDDIRVVGYFNGQSIMLDSDETGDTCVSGWVLVCVDGYPAGWGKRAGNQIKNHYPKGLRNKI